MQPVVRQEVDTPSVHFFQGTFAQALAGAAMLYAALPPLDLWPLAWFAPIWWLRLARRETLPGRRPYRALWLVGFLFWLLTYQFARLPHPANYAGLAILAAYLAFYLPVFMGLTRIGLHRLKLPLILVAPVVWAGLELVRAHFLTGITLAALGHTQYRWLDLIQVAALGGAYAVDFVVMFVAACLAQMFPSGNERRVFWPLLPATAMMAAVLLYGHVRRAEPSPAPIARVAIIQGSIGSRLKWEEGKSDFIHEQYQGLTRKAIEEAGPKGVDLVIWPESMYRDALRDYAPSLAPPPDWKGTKEEFHRTAEEVVELSRKPLADMAREFRTSMLVGVETVRYTNEGPQQYNSAIAVTPDGRFSPRYDKMHRVLFGEYVPLADRFPKLRELTPIPVNLTAGRGPVAIETAGLRLSPNICYENVLPHVIRCQVVTLQRQGLEPDVLVNLTNDSWFEDSSALDMHLVCAVFRAVECGKPMLVAANAGLSAWIDATGRIHAKSPRCQTDILYADIGPAQRGSWYLAHGDLPAGVCLAACVLLALVGLWDLLRRRAALKKAPPEK
ncbi:MAG: apolipoprotein N-acyltransferase [Pirellulales bacterium]|nr:apolipoprotein N-acyltransferase [Pirellulales bacterium]